MHARPAGEDRRAALAGRGHEAGGLFAGSRMRRDGGAHAVHGKRRQGRLIGDEVRCPDDLPRPVGEVAGHAGSRAPPGRSPAAYAWSSRSIR